MTHLGRRYMTLWPCTATSLLLGLAHSESLCIPCLYTYIQIIYKNVTLFYWSIDDLTFTRRWKLRPRSLVGVYQHSKTHAASIFRADGRNMFLRNVVYMVSQHTKLQYGWFHMFRWKNHSSCGTPPFAVSTTLPFSHLQLAAGAVLWRIAHFSPSIRIYLRQQE